MYAMSLVKMPPNIAELQKAIKATHGCDSRWLESVGVTEKFKGQIAWDGIVEVFALIGHPKATSAYAWTYREDDQDKTMTILGMYPVDSAQDAVKVAIASKARK